MKRLTFGAAGATPAATIVTLTNGVTGIARSPSHTLHITSKTLLLTGPTTAPAPGGHYESSEADTGHDRGKDYFDCVV